MRTRILLALFVFAATLSVLIQPALADPCGMVPPIYPGQEIPLARVGLQQTYVSYKDGVETFVIRPGFTSKVDQFGMLIPFPTPPAIRKVPDHVFQHIAAAVDPPEVVVDLRIRLLQLAKSASSFRNEDRSEPSLEYKEEVKVLKQEAVGMYEVAVLEAGSAAALKRWMDDHGYKYPKGMDRPCEDYVEAGWCFVAIKTKVGQKDGVDPKPGQRTVNANLPQGSTFDGHVQGMGFRFKSDELVVPMRLSAFNEGELRNVVYLLTDGPRKIRSIPEEYVVRQISGQQLYKNLTQPLPLRIIGGTEADIPEYRRKQLPQQRNPVPKNGAAGDLFASDLLAIQSGRLALPHEEREKELLRIGERLGLRGANIDKLNNQSLSEERRKTVEESLDGLKNMTLTVIDGDFPREVLGKQNLTFAEYKMPSRRNRPTSYDAKLNGPSTKKEGVLKLGELMPRHRDVLANAQDTNSFPWRISSNSWGISLLIVALVGLVVSVRLRKHVRSTACFLLVTALVLGGTLDADELSYYEKTLTEKNIDADSDGLNEYLSGLHPNELQRQRAMHLIETLGTTDSFAEREDAMAKLLVLPVLPNEELIAASNGKDPEIRWRAKKILQLGKPESDRVLYAAFKTIEEKSLEGVAAELIRAIPLCDNTHLRYAAGQALKASARSIDAALLRRELKNENVEVRIAVAAALGKALDNKSAADLNPLLKDPKDRIKLAAARAMADYGGRNCLKTLASLLSSSEVEVRSNSAAILRHLTGQRFQFTAYDVPEKRAEARDKWVAWIENNGQTAKLKFPLAHLNLERGRTLVCSGNRVIEFDASGKKTWEANVSNPWGCYGMADGRRFVASHTDRTVTEFDASGKQKRIYKLPGNPYDVQVLENGNLLVPSHDTAQAFEVRPDGSVAWENKSGRPVGANRLENGNTLLCLHNKNKVIEVDPAGKEVWSLSGVIQPYTAQRLENGNTLVYISGKRTAAEYDPTGKVVWNKTGLDGYDIQRLSNSNTLIAQRGLREIDPNGKTVWQVPNLSVTRFHRY